MSRSLFICAGDISGDMHASRLISRLKEAEPDLKVWGVGGPALEKCDVELLYNAQNLAVIGIVGVLKVLPMLAKVRAHLLEEIEKRRPDAVLLVDYGGFNLNIAGQIRKRFPDLPIVYFISPQVWGSRPWRIKAIERAVTKMLVIFPFEEALYRGKGINSHFVGHPLTERYAGLDLQQEKRDFCSKYNLDADKPIVGIFPGSRVGEIKEFMGFLTAAVSWLHKERPQIQFVLSQASPRVAEHIYGYLAKAKRMGLVGSVLKLTNADDNQGLMAASDVLWTKSGTTTLEAAFMERPMLVYYRADWLSFVIFLMFKRVKYVAWPNILAGKMLVPELIQLDCRAEQLVRYTRDWLDVPAARARISDELRRIKGYLRKSDFAANAAAQVKEILSAAPQIQEQAIENAGQAT